MTMTRTLGLTALTVTALLSQTSALKLDLPKATVSVDLPLDGWSPKPTPPPGGLRPLRKRQFNDEIGGDDDEGDEDEDGTTVLMAPDNTCGFVSGRPGAHFTCSGTYGCVFFTASGPFTGNIACCDDFNCGVRIDCVDYEQYYSSSVCDDGCAVDAFTLKCTNSAMPYCNTVSFSESIYDFWCNSLDYSTAQSATTAYSGQDRSFSPLALEDESASFTLTEDTSEAPGPTITNDPNDEDEEDSGDDSDGGDGGSNDGDSDGSDDGDNGNDNGGGGGGGTPVGPIVGGVVGGVGALGLAGLGVWLFFRNKKKKQAAAEMSQASPSVAYANQPPPGAPGHQPPPPGQQGYYDPKFVAAGQQPAGYQQYPAQYAPPPQGQQQQQQQQHPGGFYPMGNTPPAATSTSSPTMSYADPNAVSPNGQSSPGAAYPSGVSGISPGHQHPGQQGGYLHEAPSRPEEMQRGGVHELA